MSQLIGKFVWFEHVSRDAAQAQRFYGEVLGWKVQKFPMGDFTYEMIQAGEKPVGGYGRPRDDKAPAHWTSYVSVADVDVTADKVTKAGGRIIEKPFDVPTVGRMALVADPLGATFNLFRSAQDDDADGPATTGTFHWNELWTTDTARALAFYEKALGYTHRDMDMGPAGTYLVLEQGGAPRGGIMKSPSADVPPRWLPYVVVDDADATTKRATRAGGKVVVPAEDIPTVGRFAVIADPQGAHLAVIKPAAK